MNYSKLFILIIFPLLFLSGISYAEIKLECELTRLQITFPNLSERQKFQRKPFCNLVLTSDLKNGMLLANNHFHASQIKAYDGEGNEVGGEIRLLKNATLCDNIVVCSLTLNQLPKGDSLHIEYKVTANIATKCVTKLSDFKQAKIGQTFDIDDNSMRVIEIVKTNTGLYHVMVKYRPCEHVKTIELVHKEHNKINTQAPNNTMIVTESDGNIYNTVKFIFKRLPEEFAIKAHLWENISKETICINETIHLGGTKAPKQNK